MRLSPEETGVTRGKDLLLLGRRCSVPKHQQRHAPKHFPQCRDCRELWTRRFVAASAPHRGEAFAGAREIIDEIKARAPIWKAEEGDWVEGSPPPTP